MARRSREPRALDYTPEALADLDAIWDWNAGQYGQSQADRYLEFPQSQTNRLRRNLLGRPVPTRPDFRYVTIRRRSRVSAIFRRALEVGGVLGVVPAD
jgi:plasmid stabilization system protein ParE